MFLVVYLVYLLVHQRHLGLHDRKEMLFAWGVKVKRIFILLHVHIKPALKVIGVSSLCNLVNEPFNKGQVSQSTDRYNG